MNFGKYAILDKSTHTFELMPEWSWTFKPTNSEDELAIAKFITVQNPTWLEIAWRELALSFGSTTIPVSETDPKLVLEPGATVEQVEAVLKKMPLAMVQELWKALGEANPLWGPRLDPEKNPEGSESQGESAPSS